MRRRGGARASGRNGEKQHSSRHGSSSASSTGRQSRFLVLEKAPSKVPSRQRSSIVMNGAKSKTVFKNTPSIRAEKNSISNTSRCDDENNKSSTNANGGLKLAPWAVVQEPIGKTGRWGDDAVLEETKIVSVEDQTEYMHELAAAAAIKKRQEEESRAAVTRERANDALMKLDSRNSQKQLFDYKTGNMVDVKRKNPKKKKIMQRKRSETSAPPANNPWSSTDSKDQQSTKTSLSIFPSSTGGMWGSDSVSTKQDDDTTVLYQEFIDMALQDSEVKNSNWLDVPSLQNDDTKKPPAAPGFVEKQPHRRKGRGKKKKEKSSTTVVHRTNDATTPSKKVKSTDALESKKKSTEASRGGRRRRRPRKRYAKVDKKNTSEYT